MPAKGYKTIVFNVLMTLGTLVAVWTGHDTKAEIEVLSENIEAILSAAVLVWGIGNAWLRAVTDSPIFRK